MKVLIVEDDYVSSQLLRQTLEKLDFETDTVSNGAAAWERFQTEAFQIVISDWIMPQRDGLDLCRAIRARKTRSYVYFILVTARDQREDQLEAMQAGVDDFLTKPLDIDELKARLHVAQRILKMELDLQRHALELAAAAEQIENHLQSIHAHCADLEHANAQLQAIVVTDGLTGLKTHRAFQDRLEDEIHRAERYAHPLSLIMLDVDHFKSYNDTYGHPAGDEVLRIVARTLQQNARESDFIARYGGEEFAIVLPNTDQEGAIMAAERFRMALKEVEWSKRPVTASFGIATLRSIPQSRAELIVEADEALYASKQKGRDCISYAGEPALV